MSRPVHHATPEDGGAILRILESSAAKGSIELLYTRRPDAYASYMKEDGEPRVFVSRKEGRIVGTCAELIREVYLGGEVARAAYICGLKKDADYDGGIGFGAELIRDLCREDIDCYFCSVVLENIDAQRMFEKSRRGISMTPRAPYRTYILNPKVRVKAPAHTLAFRQAAPRDAEALLNFLNGEGRRRDLFPVIRSLDQFEGLAREDFYLLLDGDRIVAAAALWDQTGYKQYVVKRYGGLMRLCRALNPLLSALGYIKLPRADQPPVFPMLSFFVCEDDREDLYRIFLRKITRVANRKYGMLVIGLPRAHFAAKILDGLPSIHFDTRLYEVSFPWSERPLKSPDPARMYPECGLM